MQNLCNELPNKKTNRLVLSDRPRTMSCFLCRGVAIRRSMCLIEELTRGRSRNADLTPFLHEEAIRSTPHVSKMPGKSKVRYGESRLCDHVSKAKDRGSPDEPFFAGPMGERTMHAQAQRATWPRRRCGPALR